MQVTDHDTAVVNGLDSGLQPAVHVENPGYVLGGSLLLDHLARHRIALDEMLGQWSPLDVVESQEVMPPYGEMVADAWYRVETCELQEYVPLALKAGDRICAINGEPGKRPGLLEHHRRVIAWVDSQIHASSIGEMESALDAVRHLAHRWAVACSALRVNGLRHLDPAR